MVTIQCECEACKAVRALTDEELDKELCALINELSRRQDKVLYIVEMIDQKPQGAKLQ